MTLAELNRLNLKEIASWPLPPKLAALGFLLAAILLAGYWFDWREQLASLEGAHEQELKLRETFLAKKKQAVNLSIYKQQVKEIEQAFGALLKQLPNKSEMDAMLTDINQAGLGRGLEFDLFKPAPQETASEFYAELPITLRINGAYHDLGAFASDIAHLPRIVTLKDLSITPGKDGKLIMEATARTFRYLDEEEIAEQKKKAAKKAKEKGTGK